MDQDEFARRRQAFGRAVDLYDRTRPTYPADAVAWSLGDPDGPRTVVDLGAGTGKLTAVLLAAGHRVVAIEPDEAMLERLVDDLGDHPSLETHLGAAEDLPLEDDSVDAVVAGQAWHWFDQRVVRREAARVLGPGGTVAALWNSRDESVDWVARWSEIAEEQAHPTGRKLLAAGGGPAFGPAFTDRQEATFRHGHELALPDDLVALAASRSWTIALDDERRAVLLDAIRRLAETHPALAGRDRVAMPYVVECHRARHFVPRG